MSVIHDMYGYVCVYQSIRSSIHMCHMHAHYSNRRWVRQPLLDVSAINTRLDIVQVFKDSITARNALSDAALKGLPDVDNIMARCVCMCVLGVIL